MNKFFHLHEKCFVLKIFRFYVFYESTNFKICDVIIDITNIRFYVSSFWLNGWVFVYKLTGCSFESRCSHLNFRYRAVSSKMFLDIQVTAQCRFTLKRVCDMIRTHSPLDFTLSIVFLQPQISYDKHFWLVFTPVVKSGN